MDFGCDSGCDRHDGCAERIIPELTGTGGPLESADRAAIIYTLEGEPMGEEPASIFERISLYTWTLLGLSTGQQMRTWQYILVAYCHLEALALELLRLLEGTDEQTYWASDDIRKKTLHPAATELSDKHLAPEDIIQILKAVAQLRHSVAHKSLLGRITAAQQRGDMKIPVNYDGHPLFDVFDDQGNMRYPSDPEHSGVDEATLERLTTDIDHAISQLNRLRQAAALSRGPYGP
jgi:hypothetical protein